MKAMAKAMGAVVRAMAEAAMEAEAAWMERRRDPAHEVARQAAEVAAKAMEAMEAMEVAATALETMVMEAAPMVALPEAAVAA